MTASEVKLLEGKIRELQAEMRRAEKELTYWKNLNKEGQKHWEANSASRDLLDALLEYLPTVVWTVDCEGRILQFLGKGLEILGLGGGEVYGQSIFAVFGDNPVLNNAIQRALKGETFSQIISLNSHDLACDFLPQWNAEQDVIAVRCVALVADVLPVESQQEASSPTAADPTFSSLPKSADGPMHALETPLHGWLESAPGFVLSVDRDGTIGFINRAIPPLRIEDVMGSSIYDFIVQDRREEIQEFLARAFTTGETVDYEIDSSDPDGELRTYACRLGPFKSGAEVRFRDCDCSGRYRIAPRGTIGQKTRERIGTPFSRGHNGGNGGHRGPLFEQPLGGHRQLRPRLHPPHSQRRRETRPILEGPNGNRGPMQPFERLHSQLAGLFAKTRNPSCRKRI